MKKLATKGEEVRCIKQVPVYPSDRLKRKRTDELVFHSQLNKKSKNDGVVFIKQVPIHPQDRLKKLAGIDEKVKFIKQTPVHPRDRLKREVKSQHIQKME